LPLFAINEAEEELRALVASKASLLNSKIDEFEEFKKVAENAVWMMEVEGQWVRDRFRFTLQEWRRRNCEILRNN